MDQITQQTTELLRHLIQFPSVSSTSNRKISDDIACLLDEMGFGVEKTSFTDDKGVQKINLVACRHPTRGVKKDQIGGLAYFAHTDVVPVVTWSGPLKTKGKEQAEVDASVDTAFDAVLTDDRIYGRGACDMKGSIATMLTAIKSISIDDQTKPLWVVCTADEEVGFDGAKHLVKYSAAYRGIVQSQPIAIIGEPTELSVVHAHKGITGFEVTSLGKSAHSSTDDGINANDALMPILQLVNEINHTTRRDNTYHDPRFDPPHLSWNYGIRNSKSAFNITTEQASVWVTLRTMPEIDGQDLIDRVRNEAAQLKLDFKPYKGGSPVWIDSDQPFMNELCQITGTVPRAVCYGTDGGEFSELDRRVVLGPGSIKQAHTSDEWISLDQLKSGTELYADLVRRYCCDA
jgi:acetylornithine deacetylase